MRRHLCVRSEARPWLLFLWLSYWGVSLGYTLYAWINLWPMHALWIQEAFLYAYACAYAPCLFLTFKREQRYWREHSEAPHSAAALAASHAITAHGSPRAQQAERLLGGATPNSSHAGPSSPFSAAKRALLGGGGGGRANHSETGHGGHGAPSPALHAPPGASALFAAVGDSANAHMLRKALGGVRIVPPDEMRVTELIGSGGFAEVYRATWQGASVPGAVAALAVAASPLEDSHHHHQQQQQQLQLGGGSGGPGGGGGGGGGACLEVAVKVLKAMPRQADGLAAFCKEIGLMQRLRHPNVIPLLGVSLSRNCGTLSVITELMPRGSVFQLLHPMGSGRPGVPLPRVLAMRMLADCARGMSYLHSMSPPIIHRDLKSQNLLVAADYSVKVADFGLSREALLGPAAMTRVGSVQWAAPEVLLGKEYSHQCDLWSFGVVCWEVLTARVPFDGMAQTTVATKVAVEGLRLPVPPRTPLRLLRLIARCWSEQPELRPSFDHAEIEIQGTENMLIAEGEADATPTNAPAVQSSQSAP